MTKNDIKTARIEYKKEEAKTKLKADILEWALLMQSDLKDSKLKQIFNDIDDVYDTAGLCVELMSTSKDMINTLAECLC